MAADPSPENPNEPARLHGTHIWALRSTPYLLWIAAIWFIVAGTAVTEPGATAIAEDTLGAALLIAGGAITRAKDINFKDKGIATTMAPLQELDPPRPHIVVTPPAIENTTPAAIPAGETPAAPITFATLVAAARANGWTYARSTLTGDIHLNKIISDHPTNSGIYRGDTVTFVIPINNLPDLAPDTVVQNARRVGLLTDDPAPPAGI